MKYYTFQSGKYGENLNDEALCALFALYPINPNSLSMYNPYFIMMKMYNIQGL